MKILHYEIIYDKVYKNNFISFIQYLNGAITIIKTEELRGIPTIQLTYPSESNYKVKLGDCIKILNAKNVYMVDSIERDEKNITILGKDILALYLSRIYINANENISDIVGSISLRSMFSQILLPRLQSCERFFNIFASATIFDNLQTQKNYLYAEINRDKTYLDFLLYYADKDNCNVEFNSYCNDFITYDKNAKYKQENYIDSSVFLNYKHDIKTVSLKKAESYYKKDTVPKNREFCFLSKGGSGQDIDIVTEFSISSDFYRNKDDYYKNTIEEDKGELDTNLTLSVREVKELLNTKAVIHKNKTYFIQNNDSIALPIYPPTIVQTYKITCASKNIVNRLIATYNNAVDIYQTGTLIAEESEDQNFYNGILHSVIIYNDKWPGGTYKYIPICENNAQDSRFNNADFATQYPENTPLPDDFIIQNIKVALIESAYSIRYAKETVYESENIDISLSEEQKEIYNVDDVLSIANALYQVKAKTITLENGIKDIDLELEKTGGDN